MWAHTHVWRARAHLLVGACTLNTLFQNIYIDFDNLNKGKQETAQLFFSLLIRQVFVKTFLLIIFIYFEACKHDIACRALFACIVRWLVSVKISLRSFDRGAQAEAEINGKCLRWSRKWLLGLSNCHRLPNKFINSYQEQTSKKINFVREPKLD